MCPTAVLTHLPQQHLQLLVRRRRSPALPRSLQLHLNRDARAAAAASVPAPLSLLPWEKAAWKREREMGR
jgi:hypothetical protein